MHGVRPFPARGSAARGPRTGFPSRRPGNRGAAAAPHLEGGVASAQAHQLHVVAPKQPRRDALHQVRPLLVVQPPDEANHQDLAPTKVAHHVSQNLVPVHKILVTERNSDVREG